MHHSKEQDNKAIVGRWLEGFWGNPWNPAIVEELAAPDMLLHYSLHESRRGRDDIRASMTDFREAFPNLMFGGAADLIVEGDYVVGRWEGGFLQLRRDATALIGICARIPSSPTLFQFKSKSGSAGRAGKH